MPSSSPLWGSTAADGFDAPQKWRISPLAHRPVDRIGAVLAAVAAVALLTGWALLVWVGRWYTPPHPIAVVAVGAGYETNLSLRLNVYGWRSAQRLSASENRNLRPVGPPFRLRAGDDWARDLDATATSPTTLVYFALHGGADAAGPYLIYDDADARMVDQSILRVRAVIARLASLPPNHAKVLVFDATHQRVDPQRGMFWNDFARSLATLDAEIAAVPNLVVISASGPDERSWAIPEYGESAFGYFLRKGLSGDIGDLAGDSVVTLDEAFTATGKRLQNWARANRGINQRPVMLPSGDEGMRRASRIHLGPRVTIPEPALSPPAPLPPEVSAAWTTAEGFASQSYPPGSYAPIEWRRYLELLLRYEHLVEADDHESAIHVRTSIRKLEEVFHAGPVENLGSLGLALPMPAAIGIPIEPSEAARRLATEIRDATPAEATKKWQAAMASLHGNPRAEVLLRLGTARLILEQATEDPGFRRKQAIPLLGVLMPPVVVAPAEVTFLRLTNRDLPAPGPPEDVLRQALETQILAQRVAIGSRSDASGYAERIAPFTRYGVGVGDRARLPAQDLLLSPDPTKWAESRTGFTRATEAYREAARIGNSVAIALAARDRVFAILPFLARTIASRQRPPAPDEQQRWEQSLTTAEDVWADANKLDEDIRAASIASDPHERTAGFAARSANINRRLDGLMSDLITRSEHLCGVDLPSVWRDADDSLSVPFLSADLRSRLIANKRAVSWRFLTQGSGDVLPPVSDATMSGWAVDESQRTGRLILSAVGRVRFDRFAGAIDDGYEVTEFRLRSFPAEPEGWKSRIAAGAAFVRRFDAAPAALAKLLEEAAARTGDGPLGPLAEADSLARVLPPSIAPQEADDPTAMCRTAYLGRLLTNLAHRTWEEHWFSADLADEPYYRRAGRVFVTDAAVGGDPAAVRKVREKLAQPGGLAVRFEDSSGLVLTTEAEVTTTGTLGPDGEKPAIPKGWAVWRVDPATGLGWAGTAGGPAPLGVGDTPVSLVIPLRNELLKPSEEQQPTTPAPVRSQVGVYAMFRGQRITNALPVTVYPRPIITENEFPPPQRASLAIRATPTIIEKYGASTGSVVFVLDCSGSMGPAEGEQFGPTTKFAQAIKVLEEVLQDIPQGTTVSVWAFGQAVGPGKSVDDAEQTISRIIPPTKWDPADVKATETLLKRVRYPALEPWNESPVLRAMLEAKADLVKAIGYKTMIVLTDGADNRYEKDLVVNPKGKAVPAVLRDEFRGSGIAVHVVGFRLPADEEAIVRKQFEALKELDPPGSFTPAEDVKSLEVALRRALRRTVRYQILSPENVLLPGIPDTGLAVGIAGGGDRWYTPGLLPGAEKVRILASPYLVREVDLAAGDRLLLDLRETSDGLRVGRAEYAANDFPGRPWAVGRDWRLTVAQNQRVGIGMSALCFMERKYDPAERTLIQPRPKQVWFDLRPAGDKHAPIAVTWAHTPGYPAAAWTVDSPGWPDRADGGPSRPVLSAWWNPDQEPTVASRLDRGIDFRNLSEISGRKLFADGDPIRILGAAIEEHVVDVAPGVRKRVSCLAVRVAHDPQNPIRVRVKGLIHSGTASWYYPEVGRSTALFWPVDAEAIAKLTAIELVSIRALRREAEARGFTATFGELAAPDPGDTRPPPPLPLP
ncbi:MAG: VWA domain-containing protein [Planctomycetes bacterium]|nr:VWA domain-containing protein [Planctomycetota bacterium]